MQNTPINYLLLRRCATAAIDRLLDSRTRRPSLLLSIHDFTPVLNGRTRRWRIGISHWRDRRFAALMLGVLTRSGEFTVGDNAPYPIDDDVDYTIPVHGEGRGLPGVMIEIRQDEIRTAAGAAAWAARLAESFRLVEGEALRIFGSSFSVHSASDPSWSSFVRTACSSVFCPVNRRAVPGLSLFAVNDRSRQPWRMAATH